MTEPGRRPPASVGPPPRQSPDNLTDSITDLTEGVRGGMQKMKELHRTSAVGMRAIMDEEDKLKSELVSAAFIAHGQGPAPSQEVTSRDGASITLKPAPTPQDDKSAKLQAALVQATTAILSIVTTVLFVYVLEVDIPVEVAVLIPILGQSIATIINNFVIGKNS